MTRNVANVADTTGNTAVGDLTGDSLLVEIISRIDDEQERVLIIAHKALDIPLSNLADELGTSRAELSHRVDIIIAKLSDDADLAATLNGISRAGSREHFQALIIRLGLKDWFCAYCGQFMTQRERGRKRRTCSDKCRGKLFRAQRTGQQARHLVEVKNHRPVLHPVQPVSQALAQPDKIRKLMEPVNLGARSTNWRFAETFWWQPETQSRDRALLLLGLTCPVPLSSSDLSLLDINDVIQDRRGLEVRLRQRTDKKRRYVIVPPNDDPELCPVRAILTWRKYLSRLIFNNSGPLFIRMDSGGRLPREVARLTDYGVAKVITNAASYNIEESARSTYIRLRPSEVISNVLNAIPD